MLADFPSYEKYYLRNVNRMLKFLLQAKENEAEEESVINVDLPFVDKYTRIKWCTT